MQWPTGMWTGQGVTPEQLNTKHGQPPPGVTAKPKAEKGKIMKLYTHEAVKKILDAYAEQENAEYYEIEPGCCGYGFIIITGEGLKTTVIKEVPLNEWSSAHTIRMYNKCPAKYAAIIEAYLEEEEEGARA